MASAPSRSDPALLAADAQRRQSLHHAEESALPYEAHVVSFDAHEQRTPEYLSAQSQWQDRRPRSEPAGGRPLALFESGAILIYLADKSGLFLPQLSIATVAKPDHEVIRVADEKGAVSQTGSHLAFEPQIQHVVQEANRRPCEGSPTAFRRASVGCPRFSASGCTCSMRNASPARPVMATG